LIRHGETDYNLKKRYCGFSDVDLNEKGKSQARMLSDKLHSEKVHKIYSSNMKRTLQFAGIIFGNRYVEQFAELREINFGVLEGLTYEQILDKYPKSYKKWLKNPVEASVSGVESLKALVKRVRKALGEILAKNVDKTVAVFTHAGPLRVILCDVSNMGFENIWQINPDNGSLNTVEFIDGKGKWVR